METLAWQLLSIEFLPSLATTMLSPSRSLSIYDLPSLRFSCSRFSLYYSELQPHHVPDQRMAQLMIVDQHSESSIYALSRS